MEPRFRRVGAADVQPSVPAPVARQPKHEELRARQVEIGPQEEIVVAVRLDHDATRYPVASDAGERDHGVLGLVLVGQEVERLVVAQGPAHLESRREAAVGVVHPARSRQRVDETARSVDPAADPLDEGAGGRHVGPLLGDDVQDAAAGPAELGRELVRHHHELLDHLLREKGVQRRAAGQIVVVQSVDQERVGPPGLSVRQQDRRALPQELSGRRRQHRAVDQRQVGEGAAVERQVLDDFRADTQLAGRARRIDDRRLGAHGDVLGEGGADLEIKNQGLLQVQGDGARLAGERLAETRQDGPLAGGKKIDAIAPAGIGDRGALGAGRERADQHQRARGRPAVARAHCSGEGGRGGLGTRRGNSGQDQDEEDAARAAGVSHRP